MECCQSNTVEYPQSDGEPRDRGLVRPRIRSECFEVPRPCPFVTCYYNLFGEWSGIRGRSKRSGKKTRSIRDLIENPLDVPAEKSCILDISLRGSLTLEDVGYIMDLTRERVRQIQSAAIRKISNNRELTKFVLSENDISIKTISFIEESFSTSELEFFSSLANI